MNCLLCAGFCSASKPQPALDLFQPVQGAVRLKMNGQHASRIGITDLAARIKHNHQVAAVFRWPDSVRLPGWRISWGCIGIWLRQKFSISNQPPNVLVCVIAVSSTNGALHLRLRHAGDDAAVSVRFNRRAGWSEQKKRRRRCEEKPA